MSLPAQMISVVLFIYGLMNIVGNTIAGRGLSSNSNGFISIQPAVIGIIYLLLLFVSGKEMLPALSIVFIWGISVGAVANTIQYWVTTAAPGAPEFANGLYLKNHFFVLEGFLWEGKQEQAREYLQDITGQFSEVQKVISTGSGIVDAILNDEFRECEEKLITMKVKGILYAPLQISESEDECREWEI